MQMRPYFEKKKQIKQNSKKVAYPKIILNLY